jgi:hypothetical protein
VAVWIIVVTLAWECQPRLAPPVLVCFGPT